MPIQNYTIDDSQWSTPSLSLSPGWNMLRTNGANEYINATQVGSMTPLLDNFWNSSISWTTSAGSSNLISFVGTDIWAYGLSGPDQGTYSASLDDKTMGTYSAQADTVQYDRLLFAAHGLKDETVHYLSFTNLEDGASLAFDYAIVSSGMANPSVENVPTASQGATTTTASGDDGFIGAMASGIGGLAQAQESKLVPNQYTHEQLASLLTPYKTKWDAGLYFVVIFSGIIILTAILVALRLFFVFWWNSRGAGGNTTGEGESYLIRRNRGSAGEKPRPSTKIMNALRGKDISHPMPSEDGHSEGYKRGSDGTGTGSYHSDGGLHGW